VTPVGYGEIDRGQYDTVTECISCGGAMMVRTDVFQELGGFDSLFDPFGPEDMDFSLRLQNAGYQALYVPQAMAYHAVSHTFGKGYSEDYARLKSRHWFKFMRRHASPWQQLAFFLFGAPYWPFKC
jgi:GT2 family glycosyltransferase